MTHFSLNGVETPLPFSPGESIQSLLSQIRSHFVSESSLISSISINGLELSEQDESDLGILPMTDVQTVAIQTAHPREIAEDTLQSLITFSDQLERMSLLAAQELPSGGLDSYGKLIEGILTFHEALAHAKQILKIGVLQKVTLLEADLLSIMKDLNDAREKKQMDFVIELLRDHLPACFAQWRDEGIPALIRSRDS
jgi:hypothetical protein